MSAGAPDRRRAAALLALFPAAARSQPTGPGALMARAEEMRRRAVAAGDQPYGAIIADGDRILGESPSRVVTDRDPTAHAEMSAIRDAARRGATLAGATLYATSVPCSMCRAAAAWVGIARMIHGAGLTDAGRP